jgi:hypothetical protein
LRHASPSGSSTDRGELKRSTWGRPTQKNPSERREGGITHARILWAGLMPGRKQTHRELMAAIGMTKRMGIATCRDHHKTSDRGRDNSMGSWLTEIQEAKAPAYRKSEPKRKRRWAFSAGSTL